jgi:hypothetical protein
MMKVTLKLPNLKEIRPRNMETRETRRAELLASYKRWFPQRSIQHMLDLDDRYPEVEIFGDQCISAEVGAGWAPLVEECLKVLALHGCKVGQIKQKFCELRVYWDYPPHIELAIAEWRRQDPSHLKNDAGEWVYDPPMPYPDERARIASAVNPVIAAMAQQSLRTCEDCGADLGRDGGPSAGRRQCEECRASSER